MKFSNSSLISLIASSTMIFTTIAHGEDKVPLIYDIDANYDDFVALMYVASNPLFDLKAVTTAGAGFSSHHGGPINTQQILELFDKGDVPVSFGKPLSLSPMTSFPLQWKIELDEFFQYSNLTKSNSLVSVYGSDQLISKILRESPVAVAIAITGPVTNLALALQREPELINRISGIFMMGSNYGGGPNNVYDWRTYEFIIVLCAYFQNTIPNILYVAIPCDHSFFICYLIISSLIITDKLNRNDFWWHRG